MNNPFSLEQAEKICRSYQFLEGMKYDKDFYNTTPILAVMVAPYKEQAQQEFVDDFDMLGYTDLTPFDSKDGYEVIVVSRYQPDVEVCLWMDVRSFVKRNITQVAKRHKEYITSAQGSNEAMV